MARVTPKKKAASRAKKAGPRVSELIVKAVSSSKERRGMTLPALKKALAASGYDVVKNRSRIKLAVRNLVRKRTLLRTKGTGGSGSYKLNKKSVARRPAKKGKRRVRKTATKTKKRARKTKAKKSTRKTKAKKRSAAKKARKSAGTKKSSKRARRPAKRTRRLTSAPRKRKSRKARAPRRQRA